MMDYTRQGRGLRRRRLGHCLNYKRELRPAFRSAVVQDSIPPNKQGVPPGELFSDFTLFEVSNLFTFVATLRELIE